MIICSCSALFFSCKKDKAIGPPVEIKPDYVLPQGNASKAANDLIQSIYNNYGSYFLYNFTQEDYRWLQSTGSGNPSKDTAVLGDPAYVEDMLNFLNDIWLKFLPENFKKGPGLPYRLMMCDTIKTRRDGTGWPPGMEYYYEDYKIYARSITFAGMNSSLRTMTAAEKNARKNIFISVIFNYYLGNNIIDVPAAFYNVSDYSATNVPVTPITGTSATNTANREAFRTRGFLPASYSGTFVQEWMFGSWSWPSAKSNDISSFLLHVTTRTDAEMAPYLTYPRIKQKFDLLVNHFQTKYGIDVRAIANASF